MTVTSTTIETVSGCLVDLANPTIDVIKGEDIAWALSREPRFGSHTITEDPYTVGQHSIQVMKLLEQAFYDHGPVREAVLKHFGPDSENHDLHVYELLIDSDLKNICPKWIMQYGLLHDASEAYLRDLPSPVKQLPGLREAYLAVEWKLMNVIFEKYKIDPTRSDFNLGTNLVHWADLYARTIEAYHFMPSRGAFWPRGSRIESVSLIDLQQFELPRKSIDVYEEFLLWIDGLWR